MSYLLFDFVKTNAFSLHSSDVSSQKNLRWAHAPAAWSKKNLRRRDAPVCKGGDHRFCVG